MRFTLLSVLLLCIHVSFVLNQQIESVDITIGLHDRKYDILIPQDTNSSNSSNPTVVFFFRSWNASDDNEPYYMWDDLAMSENFIVIFPEPYPITTKDLELVNVPFLKKYDDGYNLWDVGHLFSGVEIPPYRDSSLCTSIDISFFEVILQELESTHGVDGLGDIIVGGHGVGAMFAYYLSQCKGNRIKGVFAHSGGINLIKFIIPKIKWSFPWFHLTWPIQPFYQKTPLTTLILHDIKDQVVPYIFSFDLASALNSITPDQPLTFVKLNGSEAGLGHDFRVELNSQIYNYLLSNTGNFSSSPAYVNVVKGFPQYSKLPAITTMFDIAVPIVVVVIILLIICFLLLICIPICLCCLKERHKDGGDYSDVDEDYSSGGASVEMDEGSDDFSGSASGSDDDDW